MTKAFARTGTVFDFIEKIKKRLVQYCRILIVSVFQHTVEQVTVAVDNNSF